MLAFEISSNVFPSQRIDSTQRRFSVCLSRLSFRAFSILSRSSLLNLYFIPITLTILPHLYPLVYFLSDISINNAPAVLPARGFLLGAYLIDITQAPPFYLVVHTAAAMSNRSPFACTMRAFLEFASRKTF